VDLSGGYPRRLHAQYGVEWAKMKLYNRQLTEMCPAEQPNLQLAGQMSLRVCGRNLPQHIHGKNGTSRIAYILPPITICELPRAEAFPTQRIHLIHNSHLHRVAGSTARPMALGSILSDFSFASMRSRKVHKDFCSVSVGQL
jgi:hypothetical protein